MRQRPELQADERLDEIPCSASDLLECWEERIRDTPERAKSGGVDYVGGLIDAYGTCFHELRELLALLRTTMKATILDTVTSEKMTVNGPRSWEWAENNWSCDCNRNPWGVDTKKPDRVCNGCERFLVVEAVMDDPDDYEYTLDELNAGYPEELRTKFLG